MPTRWIPYVKVAAHLLCLLPALHLARWYWTGAMARDADPVNTLTHFTGDWALILLLISLAVTPVRRLHARLSNLIRFRRLLGLYAFFYASLHLLTYVFLFSGYDVATAVAGVKAGHPGELWTQARVIWPGVWEDLRKRSFIQVGLASWVILLLLALTSPLRVLRWMGGKNWQRLHRLVYVAVFLACMHFWWQVKKGVMTPVPDTLWMFGLLLARLVWWVWQRRRRTQLRPANPVLNA